MDINMKKLFVAMLCALFFVGFAVIPVVGFAGFLVATATSKNPLIGYALGGIIGDIISHIAVDYVNRPVERRAGEVINEFHRAITGAFEEAFYAA